MDNFSLFFNFIGSHWIIIAFMAPMFWALVNIIDVYFVDGIYKDELDGTIISAIFQMLPWIILIPLFRINIPLIVKIGRDGLVSIDNALFLALMGGFIFTVAFYFYFRALFLFNDVSFVEIIFNLCIIAVPIVTFFYYGEKLFFSKYLGMLFVFIGATALSLSRKIRRKISKSMVLIMLSAVIFLSFSMVFSERAYHELNALGSSGFWAGFFYFSLGAFIGGMYFAILWKRNPLPMIKKYFEIFVIAEGLSFFGALSSQRAISLSPSVSYVVTVETFLPVFVIAYSIILLIFSHFFLDKKRAMIKNMYKKQVEGSWAKVFAVIIMAVGVYIIS